MNDPVPFVSYEDMVLKRFKDEPLLGIKMVAESVIEYKTTGDITLVLLNLSRIISVRGYDELEAAGLKRESVSGVISGKMPPDPVFINKILEALGIDERI